MTDLASVDELEKTWRPLTAAEITSASVWIRRASALLRQEVPSVDARIANGSLDADVVASVVESMVRRVMTNPDGARSMSDTVEDVTLSVTFSGEADGGLYLTDRERDRLMPKPRRSFSIAPSVARCR